MRLLLLAALAALTGCGTLADDVYRDAQREIDRYRTGGSRGYADLRRDVDDYVRDVDRAVRLDRRQADRIAERLEDRAARTVRRGRYGADAYPFPRPVRPSREVAQFWRDADRDIERDLSRRQRDDYRRFTRRFGADDRYRSRDRDDDDWDDDDDDDDWDDG